MQIARTVTKLAYWLGVGAWAPPHRICSSSASSLRRNQGRSSAEYWNSHMIHLRRKQCEGFSRGGVGFGHESQGMRGDMI